MSGNPVRKSNVEKLHKNLDHINGLDKDGLKELYKDIIKNTTISEKGGAGLALWTWPENQAESSNSNFRKCLMITVSFASR